MSKLVYRNVCVLKDTDGDIVSVVEIKTLTEDMIKDLKNKAKLGASKIVKREELINSLVKRVEDLELERKYDHGEITEEEYNAQKGGN